MLLINEIVKFSVYYCFELLIYFILLLIFVNDVCLFLILY